MRVWWDGWKMAQSTMWSVCLIMWEKFKLEGGTKRKSWMVELMEGFCEGADLGCFAQEWTQDLDEMPAYPCHDAHQTPSSKVICEP